MLLVADVDAEERVDNSLVEILKLMFGQDFEAEVWSYFAADVWLRSIILVKILSLNLVELLIFG